LVEVVEVCRSLRRLRRLRRLKSIVVAGSLIMKEAWGAFGALKA
jgi:hypothetical protein